MPEINAQTVDGVNAPTGNWRAKNARMPKKPTVHEPSEFWLRLEEAMSEKWGLEDFNANSVAMHLDMSQGTTHRWFLGTGLPEPKLALTFCKRAGVCFDWLMNGVKPKYPISKDPLLRELFEICEQIPKESRATVLSIAKGELAKKEEIESEAKTVNRGGHLRSV